MSEYGYFITVEGIDGAGKSTACQIIKDYLNSKKKDSTVIVEQNKKHPVGRLVREFINTHSVRAATDNVLLYLFLAGIQETIERDIIPNINCGRNVVSDRYLMSTKVYQKKAFSVDKVCQAIEEDFIRPQLTILMDIDEETSLERLLKDRDHLDEMENVSKKTIKSRREKFLQIADEDKHSTYVVIDASKPLEEVTKAIKEAVDIHVLGTKRVIHIKKEKREPENVYEMLFGVKG